MRRRERQHLFTIAHAVAPSGGTAVSLSNRGKLVKRGAALFAAAAVCGLAACSSSASSSGSAASAGSSPSAAGSASSAAAYAQAQVARYQTASLPPAPASIANLPDLKGKTVWYIPLIQAVPVLATYGTAMTQALGHLGITVHTCDGGALPTQVAGCMQSAISQHASAVVTGLVDYVMVPAGFQELAKANIPVLIAGVGPTGGVVPTSKLAFFDTTAADNQRAAVSADVAIADSQGKGDMLVTILTDSATTKAAGEAVVTELRSHCPGCTVHSISILSADLSKYPAAVSSALTSDPSTGYVFTPIDSYDSQALAGIRSAGFGSKVKIVTLGGGLSGLQEVQAGTTLADVSESVVYDGWSFANALLQMLAGQTPTPAKVATIKIFDSSNVGGLKLAPSEYATTDWYGSGNAIQQSFLTAWGVK
jgi:ribose transport system substrate-binding protein